MADAWYARGPANELTIGTVTEGDAAASITGTAPAQTLNLTLPKGTPGDAGPANSLSIGTVSQGAAAATITGTPPAQTLNLTLPKGDPGATGPSTSLAIGTVTSADNPSATITGTPPMQTLNLVMPKGAQGDAGPANSLSIGTVAEGAAAATITGTAPSQTLNLTVPKGAQGDQGDVGPVGPITEFVPGTTTTGDPGTNAVFDLVDTGTPQAPQKTVNVTLPRGAPGTGLQPDNAVATYADLPTPPPEGEGAVYIVTADDRIYVYIDGAWPADGAGIALGSSVTWTDVQAKPTEFPPSAHHHDAADISSGTISTARLDVGTTTGTVAAGDDGRFTAAVDISRLPVGNTTGTVAAGDDPRFGQIPTDAVPNTRTVNSHPLSADVIVTAADVGLGAVDNTADLDKPVSTATQSALDDKEPVIEPGTTSQYLRGDKTWQVIDIPTGAGAARIVVFDVGSGTWPDRPNDSVPTVFVGGDAPTDSPTDTDLRVGDVWIPQTDIGATSDDLAGKVNAARKIITAVGSGLSGGGDLTIDRSLAVNFGTTAGTVCAGNDSRLTGGGGIFVKRIITGNGPFNAQVGDYLIVLKNTAQTIVNLPAAPPDGSIIKMEFSADYTVLAQTSGNDIFLGGYTGWILSYCAPVDFVYSATDQLWTTVDYANPIYNLAVRNYGGTSGVWTGDTRPATGEAGVVYVSTGTTKAVSIWDGSKYVAIAT